MLFGFASSRNSSKNAPVAPSAKVHCIAGAVAPQTAWPAEKIWPCESRYIARSTTMGTPLVEMNAAADVRAREARTRVDVNGQTLACGTPSRSSTSGAPEGSR